MLESGSPRHRTSLSLGGSSEGIGSGQGAPSGRIGLGAPPLTESNPLRLRISFINVGFHVTGHRHRPVLHSPTRVTAQHCDNWLFQNGDWLRVFEVPVPLLKHDPHLCIGQELHDTQIEHGVMSRASHKHVFVCVWAPMCSTQRPDVMHLGVEGTVAELDAILTNLAARFIERLETAGLGRVADNPGRGELHAFRGRPACSSAAR